MKGRALILLGVMVMLLGACKYDTLEEAIANDIPFNVKKVLHTEPVGDGMIVFYLTEQKREGAPIEAMAVAYMKKDEDSKWKNVGNNHWEFKEGSQLAVYENTFYYYDHKGNLERHIPVVYGSIENSRIKKVEVEVDRERFTDAEMIEEKYFMNIGDYLVVQGRDHRGVVVEVVPKKD